MIYDVPKEYTIKKFYEYGYGVKYIKSNNSYNCSCPICLEGKSFKKKKRCFFMVDKDIIYCHNCGWSSKPLKWIKEVTGLSFDDIKHEINDGEFNIINLDKINNIKIDDNCIDSLPSDSIDLSNESQLLYYKSNSIILKAIQYIKYRRLDTACNKPKSYFISLNDFVHKNRLILPFYDKNEDILFYQSRAMGLSFDDKIEKIKYLSKSGSQKTIFNLNNISNKSDYIFIHEGPIDSCFVINGIGIGGINDKSDTNFNKIQMNQLSYYNLTHEFIWCLDSQWIDSASMSKTKILLSQGESVFIWPKIIGTKYKDFNSLCIDNKLDQIPEKMIIDNTLCGRGGLLKFNLLMLNNK